MGIELQTKRESLMNTQLQNQCRQRCLELENETKFLEESLKRDRETIFKERYRILEVKEQLSKLVFEKEIELEYKIEAIEELKRHRKLLNAQGNDKEKINQALRSHARIDGESVIVSSIASYNVTIGSIILTTSLLLWQSHATEDQIDVLIRLENIVSLKKKWVYFVKSIEVKMTGDQTYMFVGVWRRGYIYNEIKKRLDAMEIEYLH